MKKYGGVNNQKTLDEIQEATVITAPIFRNKPSKSKASVIAGWLVYYLVTWAITTLFLTAIGAGERFIQIGMPIWLSLWLVPSIPFFLTLIYVAYHVYKIKRDINSAGD